MTFDGKAFLEALTSEGYLRGALLAVGLAVTAQAVAIVLGFFLALGRLSNRRSARLAAGTYVWFFRAIPLLLILLIIWNALPQMLPAFREDWFSPFLAALIGLALAESAYMAEILRASLSSIDEGQRLAARALGLSPRKVMSKVLVPQMIRVAIPPTGNELIGMVKYTSLASVISLRELLTTAQLGVSSTFSYAEFYAAALVYYLVIVSAMMVAQSRLERRFAWVTRVRGIGRGAVPGASVHVPAGGSAL